MRPLTEQERARVEVLIPRAELIARCIRRGDEDAAAVARMALCEAAIAWRGPGPVDFREFALHYARARVLDYIRAMRRQHLAPVDPLQLRSIADHRAPLDVERLLVSLEPTAARIFVERFCKNRPVRSISIMERCSPRKVYYWLAKALAQLRAALDDQP